MPVTDLRAHHGRFWVCSSRARVETLAKNYLDVGYDVVMSNPAKYLLEFLSSPGSEQQGAEFAPLFAATVEMESQLKVLAESGYSVVPFSGLARAIRTVLNSASTDDLATLIVPSSEAPVCTLTQSEMYLLQLASERLEVDEVFDEARVKNLEDLLAWVTETVREDEGLDAHLALFITQTISAIRAELADFSITREFALRDAVIRLFGLIRAAEGASKDPSRWRDGWEKWGVPITQGLIVSLPQLAMSVPQLLKSIGQ